MFYIYILQSLKTQEFYKGITNNLERRLKQHKTGKVNSTKQKLPLKLVHVETSKTRIKARALEKFFKTGYGRDTIKEIIKY